MMKENIFRQAVQDKQYQQEVCCVHANTCLMMVYRNSFYSIIKENVAPKINLNLELCGNKDQDVCPKKQRGHQSSPSSDVNYSSRP